MRDEHADSQRFRRLDAAFRAGDLATIQVMLGAEPGFPDIRPHPAMGTCLTYALYHSPVSLVAALLDAGADPSRPEEDGFPPLVAALTCAEATPGAPARPDVDALLELLLAHGADTGQRGVDDYTPLHLAAAQGNLSAVRLLLAHGADPDAVTRIDDLETPWEIAVAAGHDAVAEVLRPLTTRPDWGQAARTGDLAELRRLVARGQDIDAPDGHGATALMRAAHGGHLAAVEWLVEQGADLDHTAKHGLTALMLAVIAGHHRVARRLVQAGADTEVTGTGPPGFDGKTAADLAEDRGELRLAADLRRGR
jgi:ankyrin repeat protein